MSSEDQAIIETFVAEELGNTAYLVGSRARGEAVIIDPARDIERYLARAEQLGLRIVAVLETHIHNDFVSGSREIARETHAAIAASAEAALAFPYQPLRDGDTIALGPLQLRTVATPGHTPEHVSYLLDTPAGMPHALFSGGSLMAGAIARPDLLGPHMAPRLASMAYHSLRERLLVLPDEVLVFPTHGGGSFCATGAGSRRSTTIGDERRQNPLALATSNRQFLTRYLQQVPYPAYYARMREGNWHGFPLLGRSLPALRPLSADAVEAASGAGAVVIDVRRFAAYDAGHIPNSLSAGIDGSMSAWVGWVLTPETSLILVGEIPDEEREAQRQLLRIGYDRIEGALEGGIAAWSASGRPLRQTSAVTTAYLARALENGDPVTILDSREVWEWANGHIPGAVLMPVAEIPARAGTVPGDAPVAVHCEHGYRSAVAASLLERAGIERILHVTDGFEQWQRTWDHDGASWSDA